MVGQIKGSIKLFHSVETIKGVDEWYGFTKLGEIRKDSDKMKSSGQQISLDSKIKTPHPKGQKHIYELD